MTENQKEINDSVIDEIDLSEIFWAMWSEKSFILLITLIIALYGAFKTSAQPDIYEASALFTQKDSTNAASGAMSSMMLSMGGFFQGNPVTNELGGAGQALTTLESKKFYGEVLYSKILHELAAYDYWDSEAKKDFFHEAVYGAADKEWKRDPTTGKSYMPSVQRSHPAFLDSWTIEPEGGAMKLSVRHQSPYIAKKWIDLMLDGLNSEVRASDIAEAEKTIAFLHQQREKTNLVNLDDMFASLIEEQTKTIMLANVADDYLFKIIDPPLVPEFTDIPDRRMMFIYYILFGVVLGSICALVRHYWIKPKWD